MTVHTYATVSFPFTFLLLVVRIPYLLLFKKSYLDGRHFGVGKATLPVVRRKKERSVTTVCRWLFINVAQYMCLHLFKKCRQTCRQSRLHWRLQPAAGLLLRSDAGCRMQAAGGASAAAAAAAVVGSSAAAAAAVQVEDRDRKCVPTRLICSCCCCCCCCWQTY